MLASEASSPVELVSDRVGRDSGLAGLCGFGCGRRVAVLAGVDDVDVVPTVVDVAVVVVADRDEACLLVFLEPPLAAPTMDSKTKTMRVHLTAFRRMTCLPMCPVPLVAVVSKSGSRPAQARRPLTSRHRNG